MRNAKKKLATKECGEKIIFFDEFSLSNRISPFYGWAKRNTRFKVVCDDSWVERTNGFMAIDATSGSTCLHFDSKARIENVVQVMMKLCEKARSEGYSRLTIILDNNPTHKKKMREILFELLKTHDSLWGFEVDFIDTPPYSPDFNLVEYSIHQLRLKLLHNGRKLPIKNIQENIMNYLASTNLLTLNQVQNTIQHIFNIGGVNTV